MSIFYLQPDNIWNLSRENRRKQKKVLKKSWKYWKLAQDSSKKEKSLQKKLYNLYVNVKKWMLKNNLWFE